VLCLAVLCLLAPATTTLTAAQATLPILIYHQVRSGGGGKPAAPDVIELSRFEEQMRVLHDEGYTPLSMHDVIGFMQGRHVADKPVAIHVDDGWRSGFALAPVLDAYGFKASFWIITSPGNDPDYASWPEIDAIAANPRFEVLSHTVSHPWRSGATLADWVAGRTPRRGDFDVERELVESRQVIETRYHRSVPYLAWPNGIYNDRLIALAREAGYTALLTSDGGLNVPGGDVFRIHRAMVDGACDLSTFKQILADGLSHVCTPASASH
jgi:peptidoglycan/xylan/chitin deacetylase (PgdA/CDA1 family)